MSSISRDKSRPVICAVGLCCNRHSETPPLPMPTSRTDFAVVGAKAANHTASDVGLYWLWRIFTRPPRSVKNSCFMLIAIYNKSIKVKGKYMLEDVIVVQSAISAFNNAALLTPAFLWYAILALPLFVVVFACADMLRAYLKWNMGNVVEKSAPWVVGLMAGWAVLMGGNYAVIRDSATVLPFVCAGILFVCSMFLMGHVQCIGVIKSTKWWWVLVLCVLGAVLMSDMHTWWGPLLQIAALVLGGIFGRSLGNRFGAVSMVCGIMLALVSAILMQPEFFRFGQLGNLTYFHLLVVMSFVVALVGALCVKNVGARGKIKQSVYVKLKWLMRTFALLAGAFFVLTEALPVFFGMVAIFWCWFVLSVRHQKNIDVNLGRQLFALALILFGVITVMPVISVIGILCWGEKSVSEFWQNFKALL